MCIYVFTIVELGVCMCSHACFQMRAECMYVLQIQQTFKIKNKDLHDFCSSQGTTTTFPKTLFSLNILFSSN